MASMLYSLTPLGGPDSGFGWGSGDHIIIPHVGYGQSIVLTHLCALQAEGDQRSGNLAPCSDPTAASLVGGFSDTGGRLTLG
jgi:hypothetical protein